MTVVSGFSRTLYCRNVASAGPLLQESQSRPVQRLEKHRFGRDNSASAFLFGVQEIDEIKGTVSATTMVTPAAGPMGRAC